MATKIDLPQQMVRDMCNAAISLRERQIKAASNDLIKKALQDEQDALTKAKGALVEVK